MSPKAMRRESARGLSPYSLFGWTASGGKCPGLVGLYRDVCGSGLDGKWRVRGGRRGERVPSDRSVSSEPDGRTGQFVWAIVCGRGGGGWG